MKRTLTAVVLVIIALISWAAITANAGFRLEYAEGVAHDNGMKVPVTREVTYYTPPAPRPVPRIAPAAPVRHTASSNGSGRCGGDLPPCWVMRRESGPTGDINARNPGGCSGRGCYGKWQCDPRTCDGTGSEQQQDDEARRVWDNGNGCSHWAAC